MDLIVKNPQLAVWGNREFRCVLGPAGPVPVDAKREGDGATPIGKWTMREVFYRADRGPKPESVFPTHEIKPDDGWCDAPGNVSYNRFVKHPYPASAEKLWRDDCLYDVVVTLGYNDDPVLPGKGSAIFLHVAKPEFPHTGGCVALAHADLLNVLREADRHSAVCVLKPA